MAGEASYGPVRWAGVLYGRLGKARRGEERLGVLMYGKARHGLAGKVWYIADG